MTPKAVRRRLTVISVAAVAVMAALGLASLGLRDAVAFFVTPSEVLAEDIDPARALSVGGLVVMGSVRSADGAMVFTLADDHASLQVRYAGIVPDLFREGQCVIAQGKIGEDGVLTARRVLAKHDEAYVPREIDAAPRLARSCGSTGRAA